MLPAAVLPNVQPCYVHQDSRAVGAASLSAPRSTCPLVQLASFWLTRSNLVQHYKEMECHRQALEQVLFDAGVDMIFAGASDLP